MDGRKDVGILAMDIYFPPTCVLQVTPSISLSAFFLLLISAFFLGEGGGGVYVSFLCSGLITESCWEVLLDAFGAPPGCAGFWVLALVVGDANGGEVRES